MIIIGVEIRIVIRLVPWQLLSLLWLSGGDDRIWLRKDARIRPGAPGFQRRESPGCIHSALRERLEAKVQPNSAHE